MDANGYRTAKGSWKVRFNMTEQLIYELSFFGMIVILIGLRLWGDSK